MASLNLPFNAREVVDKGAHSVLDEVEGTILDIASQILEGNGFAFDVPSRAKGNQVPAGHLAPSPMWQSHSLPAQSSYLPYCRCTLLSWTGSS